MYDDSEEDEWSGRSSDEEDGDGEGEDDVFPGMGPGSHAMLGAAAFVDSSEEEDSDSDDDDDDDEYGDGGMLAEYEAEQMRVLKLLGQVVRKRLGEGHPETVYANVSRCCDVIVWCVSFVCV
jgi:hypothetical protein